MTLEPASHESSSSNEFIDNPTLPWSKIWQKAHTLKLEDAKFRESLPRMSAERSEEIQQEKRLEVEAVVARVTQKYGVKAGDTLFVDYMRPEHDRINIKFRDIQHEVSAKKSQELLAEFEEYLDTVGEWKYKFTTKNNEYNGDIPEFRALDSLYRMAEDGSSIRLKKKELVLYGLKEAIQSPMERSFFINPREFSDNNKSLINNNDKWIEFLRTHPSSIPEYMLSLEPQIGLRVMEVATDSFYQYVRGNHPKDNLARWLSVSTKMRGTELGGPTFPSSHKLKFWDENLKDWHVGDLVNSVVKLK